MPRPPTPTEVAADAAIDHAYRSVLAHDRGCHVHSVQQPPVLGGAAPLAVRRAFSVLADGTSAAEAFFAAPALEDAPPGIYTDSVRRVRVLGHGRAIFVLAARVPAVGALPARCDREELTRLRQLLKRRPALLRVALHRDHAVLRHRRTALTHAYTQVCLFLRDGSSFASGGCDSVPHVRRQGIGYGTGPTHVGMLLVPDGVATVDTYLVRPRDGRIVRLRRKVRDNVVNYTEPSLNVEPYGDVWRGESGRIVNTVCALRCLGGSLQAATQRFMRQDPELPAGAG